MLVILSAINFNGFKSVNLNLNLWVFLLMFSIHVNVGIACTLIN